MMRRSRLELYFDILDVIDRGADKPTIIMYRTNISWIILNQILDVLIKSGFIEEKKVLKGTRSRYYLTDKGKDALSYHLKSIDGLIEKENLLLIDTDG